MYLCHLSYIHVRIYNFHCTKEYRYRGFYLCVFYFPRWMNNKTDFFFLILHLHEINCQQTNGLDFSQNTLTHTAHSKMHRKMPEISVVFVVVVAAAVLFARLLLPIQMPTQCTQCWIKVSYFMNIMRLYVCVCCLHSYQCDADAIKFGFRMPKMQILHLVLVYLVLRTFFFYSLIFAFMHVARILNV